MLLLSFSCSPLRIRATTTAIQQHNLRGLKKDKESKEADSKEEEEEDQVAQADAIDTTTDDDEEETCFFEPPHYRCYRNWDNGAQLTAVCPSPTIEANTCACKVTVPAPSGNFVNCNSCHLYEYAGDWGVDVDCSNVFGIGEGSVAADSVTVVEETTTAPSRQPSAAPTIAPTALPTAVPTHSPTASPTRAPQPPVPLLFGSSAIQSEESIVFYADAVPPPAESPSSFNDVQLTMRNSRTRPPSIDPETWHMGDNGTPPP